LPESADFWVKAVSSDEVVLFRSKKDAENNRNPVLMEAGTGAGTELHVRAGVHWTAEIIEFPAVLLDAATLEVVAEFRELVQPTETPQLPAFTTELTSISQSQVDSAAPLATVLPRFEAWLAEHGASDALPVTCGDWDLNIMLSTETKRKGLADLVPTTLRRWCNIKTPYAEAMGGTRAPGMAGMLKGFNLQLIGHHHLGIDDCRNIAAVLRAIVQRKGVEISATTTKEPKAPKGKAQDATQKVAAKCADKETRVHETTDSRTAVTAHASNSCSVGHMEHEYLRSIGLPVFSRYGA